MKNFLILLLAFLVPAIAIASFDRAVSESMEPTLFVGDWYVENFLDRNIQIGDIATFECLNTQKCEGIYTHRLISVDPKGCMSIEGDNQKNSLDTRDFGCLMPSDIRVYATVYPLKSLFEEKAAVSYGDERDLEAFEMEKLEENNPESLYRGTR